VGDIVPLFGASYGGEKKKVGWALAIDGCRLKILHTPTNQKQAARMEGTMKEGRDEWEARGKHDSIVFGRHYS
jgi:hypothetical protein